jgi:ribosomal protein L37AE/L43A
VWIGVTVADPDRLAELRGMDEAELQLHGYGLGRYGQLQEWRECSGCQPRPAAHGVLCDQCFTRLSGWFVGPRNLGWCWYWLASDLIPGQSAQGDKVRGTRTPPAAMSIAAYDLRQDILAGLGGWLGTVCGQFQLDGPVWFRRRLEEARRRQGAREQDPFAPWAEMDWRAWLPQDAPLSDVDKTTEIQDACRYLAGWLEKVCGVEDLALSMYDQAGRLYRQVQAVAPWEAKAQRMPGLICPTCEREALVRWEGDEHLKCRRCGEIVTRQRYDVWAYGLTHHQSEVAS